MELRVERALQRGLDTKSVAAHLSISTKTANAHISNVLRRTGAENRAQLIAHLIDGSDADD